MLVSDWAAVHEAAWVSEGQLSLVWRQEWSVQLSSHQLLLEGRHEPAQPCSVQASRPHHPEGSGAFAQCQVMEASPCGAGGSSAPMRLGSAAAEGESEGESGSSDSSDASTRVFSAGVHSFRRFTRAALCFRERMWLARRCSR